MILLKMIYIADYFPISILINTMFYRMDKYNKSNFYRTINNNITYLIDTLNSQLELHILY